MRLPVAFGWDAHCSSIPVLGPQSAVLFLSRIQLAGMNGGSTPRFCKRKFCDEGATCQPDLRFFLYLLE